MSLTTLDTSCEWNHIVFVLLWLAYFTEHNVLQLSPCYSKYQNFLLFLRLNILLHVCTTFSLFIY